MSPEKSSDESTIKGAVRSREMQEIMGYIPRWIVRWGVTVIAVSLVLILLGSYYFTYSETIASAPIHIFENSPAAVDCKADGKISNLLVPDGQAVNRGDTIAVMENPADFRRVRQIKYMLNNFNPLIQDLDRSRIAGFKSDSLGSLTPAYEDLLKTLDASRYFQQADKHVDKLRLLDTQHLTISQNQIAENHELINDSSRYAELVREEIGIISDYIKEKEKTLKMDSAHSGKSVSPDTGIMGKELELADVEDSLEKTRLRIIELERAILKTRIQYNRGKKAGEIRVEQAEEKLLAGIAQWESKFLLKAPVSGMVRWKDYDLSGKLIKAGTIVAYVDPSERGKVIGRMKLAGSNLRGIRVGQNVNARFPSIGSGLVKGRVSAMSFYRYKNTLIVEVEFPEGLKSTRGKRVPFSHKLKGDAEILGEEISILKKTLGPLGKGKGNK